jgi:hypothetical protein
MKFSRFALLLQGKAFIPTLSTLRKGADPREATLSSLREAIEGSKALRGAQRIVVKVGYCLDGYRILDVFDDNNPHWPHLKNPYRPYAYKAKSYEFESEVRVVFRVNYQPAFAAGALVDIDPHVLLKGGEVVISPYLKWEEGHALKDLVRALLKDDNIAVRRSAERGEWGQDIDEWTANLPPPPDQWPKRFEIEEGLPALLREL